MLILYSDAHEIITYFLNLSHKARGTLAFKTSAFVFSFRWTFVGENITGNSVDTVPGLSTALYSFKFLLGYRHIGQYLFS